MSISFNHLIQLLNPVKILNQNCLRSLEGFSIDSRKIKDKEAFIALKGVFFDGHQFITEAVKRGASLVISEREECISDSDVCSLIVEDTYLSLERIVRYLRNIKNPKTIAITGSVGKTTTKEMLAYLLERKFHILKNERSENNFLGVAKTLLNLKNQEILILELGTNSKGEIKRLASIAQPDVGVITFIKPVHLEGLSTLKEIFEEKISLLESREDIVGVLNRDDLFLRKIRSERNIYWFGKTKTSHLYARLIDTNQQGSLFLINDKFKLRLKTPAPFFIYSALGAILTATLVGLDLGDCIKRMEEFSEFPPMRMQEVTKKGITFLNDAYNSNPFSLKEAIKIMGNYSLPKIAIIGDMLELGRRSSYYHKKLAYQFLKYNFCYIITFGNLSSLLRDKLQQLGYKNALHLNSHQAIADFIRKVSKKKRCLVFIKGSRKMEMEKIIEEF
jgi:UDP-N-acetylmuramoyl-tripeptide--D-alanyl-D-alanine ligase